MAKKNGFIKPEDLGLKSIATLEKEAREAKDKSWEVHINGDYSKSGGPNLITAVSELCEKRKKKEISKKKFDKTIELLQEACEYGDIWDFAGDEEDTQTFLNKLKKAGISKELMEVCSPLEISVIRKNNEHGHKSWGWGSSSKIILFVFCSSGQNEIELPELPAAIKLAEGICEFMNKGSYFQDKPLF